MLERSLAAREKTKQALAAVSQAHLRAQVDAGGPDVVTILTTANLALMAADAALGVAVEMLEAQERARAVRNGTPDA
jgi:hypothetical protein